MSYKEERNKSAEQEISKETSKDHTILDIGSDVKEAAKSCPTKFATFIYNSEDGTICLRTPLSWLKLILTTAIYYCLLVGMVSGFYFLFLSIEYSTTDPKEEAKAPFAHAPPGSIWPTILKSPDLNIRYEPQECKYCMSVSMNKVFFWEPEAYTGKNSDLEQAMKKTNSTVNYTENMAFVSCDGKDKESKDLLDGLKFRLKSDMKSPGFYAGQFPYGSKDGEESWKKVILDLTETPFVLKRDKNKERLKMKCLVWAKNVDQKEKQSYKGRTRGGAESYVTHAIFDFLSGKDPKQNSEALKLMSNLKSSTF